MSDLTPAYCTWMREVCNLLTEEKTTQALDILYDNIDNLLLEGEFDYVDGFLCKPPLVMDTDLILGLLTITLSAKNKLPHRKSFYKEAIGELVERVGWVEAQTEMEGLA